MSFFGDIGNAFTNPILNPAVGIPLWAGKTAAGMAGIGGGNDPTTAGLLDMNGAPQLPGFNPIYSSGMSQADQMKTALANDPTKFNTNALSEISANANNPNESSWAQLQSRLANDQTNQSASRAAGQQAGATAQAEGNLAMSGGLSSGAQERAQTSGEQAGINAQQNVQQQGNQAQEQIAAADAANKQQQLMALPGMEAQAYSTSLQPIQMQGQANAQDMAAQMANNQALNNYNMGAYQNEAGMYGAGKTAAAQMDAANNSGGVFGGGGILGLGVGGRTGNGSGGFGGFKMFG